MTIKTVTLTTANSTTPGASDPINLDWIGGKPTTVLVSFISSATLVLTQVQYTVDDIQLVGGASLASWFPVVSTAASSTPAIYGSTTWFDVGVTLAFLNPIAGVRAFSTAITAGSAGAVILKALQGVGG